MTVFEKGNLNKCNSLWKSYFVTKWLTNEEGVHTYFVLKCCFKGIVHVNTDVVKWHGIIRRFWKRKTGHIEWINGVYWSKFSVSVFMDICDNLVLFASQRKSHARLLVFLLECNVEQLLHNFLWTDVLPPQLFFIFPGEALCALADF